MKPLINLNSTTLHYIGVSLSNPLQSFIPTGVTALIGPNGSGKTTLTHILQKGWNFTTNSISSPLGRLKISRIEFSDIHSLTGFKATYYQQRYEATMNDEVPTVEQITGPMPDNSSANTLADKLCLRPLMHKKANSLSSGELRKILIVRVLTGEIPDLLILDNPYIGLDQNAVSAVNSALYSLAEQGLNIILALCDPTDIPPFTDSIITIDNRTLSLPIPKNRATNATLFSYAVNIDNIPLPPPHCGDIPTIAVQLTDCTVSHSGKTILSGINWRINTGEQWALCGPNGSGKSTLLSLIHADNPQSYSNNVTVFNRRRGTGESIWDIKKLIGYISPEMHLYFGGGAAAVRDIIARGLNDTVGNFTRITQQQYSRADSWIKLMHLENIAGRTFNTLSSGEQRMTLIARTFVKNAPLLILDEPMHGLDYARKRAVKSIINALAARDRITLIYVTHCPAERPECITHTFTL